MTEVDPKEVFYVSVNNSHDLRKNILEASKGVIESLHRFEKFKLKRAEKIKAMEELIILFRETNEISSQIKVDIPKIKLPAKKKNKKEKEKEEVKKKFVHESDDELQKLENAIAQIENRLKEIK